MENGRPPPPGSMVLERYEYHLRSRLRGSNDIGGVGDHVTHRQAALDFAVSVLALLGVKGRR